MNAKRTTQFIVLTVLLALVMSACGAAAQQPAAPANDQNVIATVVEMTVQAAMPAAATPVCPAYSAETSQPLISSGDAGCFYYEPISLPASTPTTQMTGIQVASQPFGSTFDPSQWEYFAQFSQGFTEVEMHGALIDRLDTLYLNVQRDFDGGNTLTTGANYVFAVWMSDFVNEDPTQGGKLIPFLVDHDTGVFLLKPNTSITLPAGGNAYVQLYNWNGETKPRNGTPALAKGNVEATDFVPLNTVQTVLKSCQEQDFAALDRVANKNPDARLRNGWYSTAHAIAGQSIIWTKTGMVGLGWAEICTVDGITAYVAKLSGPLEVMYPFSGFNLNEEYPDYNTLPAVTASAPPIESNQCEPNDEIAETVNRYRQTNELYTALALFPSATHPAGTYDTKWNSFVITSGNAAGTNLLPINWFNTSDGFRGLYFVTTDGTSTFEANSAVITLCDGPFDIAKQFEDWWDK